MSKTVKTCIIIACVLIALGTIAFVVAAAIGGRGSGGIGSANYQTNAYEITEDFSNISIKTKTASVTLVPSEGEECKVVCYEEESLKHSVFVENDELIVRVEDERAWYEQISFKFGAPYIKIYLPKNEYSALKIKDDTGAVEVPSDFAFSSAEITLSTGSVAFRAKTSGDIKINSTTGDIRVESESCNNLNLSATTGNITANGVEVAGEFCAETTTGGIMVTDLEAGSAYLKTSTGAISGTSVKINGDVYVGVTTGKATFSGLSCGDFSSEGTTGGVKLTGVIASGSLRVERSTGGVIFEKSDADEIFVKTTTGSVSGSLLSEKTFFTSSNSGKISVPQGQGGGRCEIKTSTGNINITVGG